MKVLTSKHMGYISSLKMWETWVKPMVVVVATQIFLDFSILGKWNPRLGHIFHIGGNHTPNTLW